MEVQDHHTRKRTTGYRKLNVPVKRPAKFQNVLWWSLGVALMLLFLMATAIAYYNYKTR